MIFDVKTVSAKIGYKAKPPVNTYSIPMRLMELGYKNYKDYLRSDHWQSFRKRFFSESAICKRLTIKFGRPVCQYCHSGRNLNIHHRTYKRLGGERLSDVVLVCQDCHKRIHDFNKTSRKGLWSATSRVGRKQKKLKLKKDTPSIRRWICPSCKKFMYLDRFDNFVLHGNPKNRCPMSGKTNRNNCTNKEPYEIFSAN
jgi:hypothetical protein